MIRIHPDPTDRNVLGGELATCSRSPRTGYFRDGCCRTQRAGTRSSVGGRRGIAARGGGGRRSSHRRIARTRIRRGHCRRAICTATPRRAACGGASMPRYQHYSQSQ